MKKNKTIIMVILYLAYTSIYVARINLSMAGPELIENGIIDAVKLGILGSVFSIVYAVGRLCNGILSDRVKPYIMLSAGLFISGISNVCFSFFPPFAAIFLLWSTNAFAQSMMWSSVLCVVSYLYPPIIAKQKASVMVTAVASGNIVAILLNGWIISNIGVRFAFIVPGGIVMILGFFVLYLIKDIENKQSENQKSGSVKKLLNNKELKIQLIPAFFHGVMKDNISLWMTVYVVSNFGVNLEKSSLYILLIPVIGFCGRVMYPFIYNWCLKNEHRVSCIGFILCILSSFVLCLNGIGVIVAVISLSIVYASVSLINTSYLSIYPLSFAKDGEVASVSGVMDFVTYSGAGVSGVIYGVVIKSFGYLPMFLSWIVISAISILILYFKIIRALNAKK